MAHITTAKWTLEQYHQMLNAGVLDNQPVEPLNGEIFEMLPEGESHAASSTKLFDRPPGLTG